MDRYNNNVNCSVFCSSTIYPEWSRITTFISLSRKCHLIGNLPYELIELRCTVTHECFFQICFFVVIIFINDGRYQWFIYTAIFFISIILTVVTFLTLVVQYVGVKDLYNTVSFCFLFPLYSVSQTNWFQRFSCWLLASYHCLINS